MSKWCECLKRKVQSCDCPAAIPPPAGEVGELVERLREWGTGDDGWVRIDEAAAEACEQAADALTSLSARLAEAERYAEGLAVALAARHYPEVDVWRPLSGDLLGLLTQIDNMTSGLSRTARAERLEAALREIEMLRYGDETFLTDANKAHNIARAALDSPAPTGGEDGWVLVPKEITEEMAQAFFDARDDYERLKANKVFPRPTQADYIYRAMIAAAALTAQAARLAELERERDEARELVAALMLKHSFATGHGDSLKSLLVEFDWQLSKRSNRVQRLERENTALNVETEQRAKWQWEAINRAERLESALREATAHFVRMQAALSDPMRSRQAIGEMSEHGIVSTKAALSADAPATDVNLPKGWLADELKRVEADVAQWSEGMKDSFTDATGIVIPPAPAPSEGGDDGK